MKGKVVGAIQMEFECEADLQFKENAVFTLGFDAQQITSNEHSPD